MINGSMSEAVNEVATLEDVEAETFVRFIQWAYTGSYHVGRNNNNNNNDDVGANHNDVGESAMAEELADRVYASEEAGWQLPPPTPKKILYARRAMNKKSGYGEDDFYPRSPLENLRKAFCERDYPVFESSLAPSYPFYHYNNNVNNSNSNNNSGLSLDNQPEAFLLHAKLFVFGEKYDIQALKMRSIHNLHCSLSHHQLLPQHIPDITNLIHYSYENTLTSGDPLRDLLASYVELEMAVLIEAKPFEELLEAGGDFVGDFLKRVKKRIC